jgi:cell division protein FtsL
MTAIEHRELKGITIKNLIVTIVSTASIVVSVMTTYFQLKNDIHDVKTVQDTEYRVNEIRLKVLEGNVAVLQREVDEIKEENNLNLNNR